MSNLPAKFQNVRQPQQFIFEGQSAIRIITDGNGDPWFIAPDVCKALDYSNTSKAISDNVDPDDVAYTVVVGGSGYTPITANYEPGATIVLNESGLFALVLNSTKPKAKAFKRWVTHEVLPEIRKTGSYSLQQLTPAEVVLRMATQLVEQERTLAEHEQRLMAVEARQNSIEQGTQYFSIAAYATLKGLRIDNSTAQVYGMKASRLSREQGVSIGKVTDPRWGLVGTYHINILEQIFKEHNR